MISSIVAFFAGYAIGFMYIWELTLVMLAMFPLIVIVGGIMAQVGYLALEENWGVEVLVGWNKARM